MAISSRWLEALQQQLLAEQGGEPFSPRLGVDALPEMSGMRLPPGAYAGSQSSMPEPSGSISGMADAGGSDSYLGQLAAGVANGGIGGGLAAVLADPNAPRDGSGANAWDMFRGITKSIGRAIGSAYGNPGFGIAAQRAEADASFQNAVLQRHQAETEDALRKEAEKRARQASITRAMEGIDPTTKDGNAEAMRRLAEMGEYEIAKEVGGLYREEKPADAPKIVKRTVGDVEQEFMVMPDGSLEKWGEGMRWAPGQGSTNVTVSPQIIMPGHNQPTTATQTDLQGKTITTNEALARLRETEALYDPAFQQLGTKASMWASQWSEKLGASLSQEDSARLEQYATFRATAFDNLSKTLQAMSGAAVTPQEFERLKQSLPDPGTGALGDGDSPTVFGAKLKRATRSGKLALIRYGYAQRLGIPWDGIPLEVSTMKQRIGEQAEKEALAAGASQQEAEAIAVETVKRQFGGL